MRFMKSIAAVALCAVVAACAEQTNTGYQGWVEADLIFVSPDEAGRVVRLSVREGDTIKAGAPLYGLDDDLQKADLNQSSRVARQRAADVRSRAGTEQDRLGHAG